MERLTEYHVNKSLGAYMVCPMDCVGGDKDFICNDCRRLEELVNRLAAYEDTGLEPEEIAEVQAAMSPIPFGRFHDIMEAERDGRLVVLPCKVGTPVWEIGDFDGGNLKKRPFCVEDMSFWRFGTTVFLTREEAETALKKREEADNEAD